MSVVTNLKFFISGNSYEELVSIAEDRISDFFNVESDSVRKKFSYEIDITENLDMVDDSTYLATVIVKGRDV
jgi:hypothetical protein